ncbi:hypothetical protein ACX0HA_15010 [Flavobacterium hauense]
MAKSFLVLVLAVCSIASIKYRLLSDGITKVPRDATFFDKQYRDKYNVSMPEGADTTALYVERYYVGFGGEVFEQGKDREGQLLSVIKFYPNGCVNEFFIGNNQLEQLPELDPEVRGYRGVSFVKKNERVLDMAVPINELYHLGIKSNKIEIKGDTLVVLNSRSNSEYIYIKYKNKQIQNKYKAVW